MTDYNRLYFNYKISHASSHKLSRVWKYVSREPLLTLEANSKHKDDKGDNSNQLVHKESHLDFIEWLTVSSELRPQQLLFK